MTDWVAMQQLFGELASASHYFILLLAFGIACATLAAFQKEDWV